MALVIRSNARTRRADYDAPCLPCACDPLATGVAVEGEVVRKLWSTAHLVGSSGHLNRFGSCEVGTSVTEAPIGKLSDKPSSLS